VYGLAYVGVLPRVIVHALAIGYTCGYLADLITKSGIQLFFPATLRCVVPGNRELRLSTGSIWEYAILVLVVMSVNTRGGLATIFNEILATSLGIQEILSKHGSTNQIIVQVEGVRMIDRARVSQNSCPLVDAIGLLWEQVGEERGEQEAQIRIALKMLAEKLPLETIARLTDLLIEQIQELQSQQG
jgi:hypothetical protein